MINRRAGKRALKMAAGPKRITRLGVWLLILFPLCNSCASGKAIQDTPMTTEELEAAAFVGLIETRFTALNGTSRKLLLQKGRNELLKTAQSQYDQKIEIRNIALIRETPLFMFMTVYAKGVVVKTNEGP